MLHQVDRIVELKDGAAASFSGNYDAYLKQNTFTTSNAMQNYERIERRIANLKDKVLQFRRMKERARDPDTIKQFKRRENQAAAELEKLEQIERPTFWIDRESAAQLNYKVAGRYQKFKARNIRLSVRDGAMRSQRKLVEARNVALGYGNRLLFEGVNFDVRESEAVELRGRNGAGKTTLIRALLGGGANGSPARLAAPVLYDGELALDSQVRVGVYEQEIAPNIAPRSICFDRDIREVDGESIILRIDPLLYAPPRSGAFFFFGFGTAVTGRSARTTAAASPGLSTSRI